MEESEFIKKLKTGDGDAFRTVVEQYQKLVLNCSFKFLRNKESAEDITQEVFVEVFESIHTYRADAKLSTWIYRIAVTKCLNQIKSRTRKKRFAMLISLFDGGDGEKHMADSQTTSPLEKLENDDRKKVLAWALEKLPENQRVAFTLSKYEEMTYEEISSIMETSIASVESLIFRAKANLKKRLFTYYKHHL